MWSSKAVNTRKGKPPAARSRLKLLKLPRASKELPVTALLRNPHGVADWRLFVQDKAEP